MEIYLNHDAVTETEVPMLASDPGSEKDDALVDAVLHDGLREINRSHHYHTMSLIALLGIATGIVAAILLR